MCAVAAVLAGCASGPDRPPPITRFPCANLLDVRWRTGPDGAVTAIEGVYANACA